MSGSEIEAGLQEARTQLASLQAAYKKSGTIRVVGTLAGIAIALIYVFLFIGLTKPYTKPETLWKIVQEQAETGGLRANLESVLQQMVREVRPAYEKALRAKLEKMDMQPTVRAAVEKVVREAGPLYLQRFSDLVAKRQLLQAIVAEMRTVVQEAGPVYSARLKTMAPELLQLVREEQNKIVSHLSEQIQAELEGILADVMDEQGRAIEAKVDMTPEEFQAMLGRVLMSAQLAIENTVAEHAQVMLGDAMEISGLLDQIPEASEKDPEKLLEEIRDTAGMLLQVSLPEPQVKLEWE